MKGKVCLVGAGPGDPELLTLKALRILSAADVVLHDDLVSEAILALAPRSAVVRSVGKRHGPKTLSQESINALMVQYACRGLSVVRLKGGDPLIFGRAGEEIDALHAAGIDAEIVPGVTTATAAAAEARAALTDRRHASALVLLAGHRCAGSNATDWRALARLKATIAVYMPGERYGDLAVSLTAAGLDAATACVIVSRTGSRQSQICHTTIAQLPHAPRLPAPALLLIGDACRAHTRPAPLVWNTERTETVSFPTGARWP